MAVWSDIEALSVFDGFVQMCPCFHIACSLFCFDEAILLLTLFFPSFTVLWRKTSF